MSSRSHVAPSGFWNLPNIYDCPFDPPRPHNPVLHATISHKCASGGILLGPKLIGPPKDPKHVRDLYSSRIITWFNVPPGSDSSLAISQRLTSAVPLAQNKSEQVGSGTSFTDRHTVRLAQLESTHIERLHPRSSRCLFENSGFVAPVRESTNRTQPASRETNAPSVRGCVWRERGTSLLSTRTRRRGGAAQIERL